MKKTLLVLSVLISLGGVAQNINDQGVNFSYVQLPSTPINKSITTYQLVLDNTGYVKSNEDSLAAYQMRLSIYESSYETWLEEKKKVDKLHYMNMAAWEKSVNAGNAAAQMPVKPTYPEQPIKEEIKLPILTEDITDGALNSIDLVGYTKGEGGAVITITPLGFQDAKIKVAKTGTAATTKYAYTSSCKMPIKIKLEVPGQGVIIDEVIFDAPKVDAIKTYDNQYEHQVWLMDNYDTFWTNKQQAMLTAAINQINTMINEKCGFPLKNYGTEIYTVKKHKGHNYSDLIDAYSNVKAGYDLLRNGTDKSKSIAKIDKGISIWEKALKESDLNDNKSRVNDKVTGIIYANLAEAYMWKDDFQNADNYAQKAILSGVSKAKSAGKKVQSMASVLKVRYQANQ